MTGRNIAAMDPGIPSRSGPDFAPPEELFSRIRASVEASPASTISTRVRVAAALAAVPCLTAAVVLLGSQIMYQRPTAAVVHVAQSPVQFLVVLLLLAGLTLVATLVAVRRGAHGLGSAAVSLMMMAALVAPIYFLLSLASPLHADHPVATSVVSPWGARCLAVAAVAGVIVLGCLAGALRGSVPVASGLRGAALGAAAGAWAGLGVYFFCPGGAVAHLLVGHVLPIAAFTLLGALVLRRALRP